MRNAPSRARSPRSRWRPVAAALAWAVLALVLPAAIPTPTQAIAAPREFDTPVFSADVRGDIRIIGNVTTRCSSSYPTHTPSPGGDFALASQCGRAEAGQSITTIDGSVYSSGNNNSLPMDYVDVDGVGGTWQSSSAVLDIPDGAVVMWAGLHWQAAQGTPAPERTWTEPRGDVARVRFTAPGAPAVGLTAAEQWLVPGATPATAGWVDVTARVDAAGSGTYTTANVASCTGWGGCFGSWSLVVAYADPDEPARNLNVWHGFLGVSPNGAAGTVATLQHSVQGITPPPRGPVDARLGVVVGDGDLRYGADSFQVRAAGSSTWSSVADPRRPAGDFFNSTLNLFGEMDPDRSPRVGPYNMNVDITMTEDPSVLTNSSTGLDLRITSTSPEYLFAQLVTAAVPIYEPEVSVLKSVAPVGEADELRPGSAVEWTVEVNNVGREPIRQAVVLDPLPSDVTYIPGSLRYTEGGPADLLGPKSDSPLDDEAEYDLATRTITARIGAGASTLEGGTMGVDPAGNGSHRLVLTFRTWINGDVPLGSTITNEASAYGEGRDLDDPFGPTTTEDEDEYSVTLPGPADLRITKSTQDGPFVAGGTYDYGVRVRNEGPGAEPAAQISDVLPDGLELVAAPGSVFDEDSRTIAWSPVRIEAGQEVERQVRVRVPRPVPAVLVSEDGTVLNTARVSGEADCIPPPTAPPTDSRGRPRVEEGCESTVDNPLGEPRLIQDKVVDVEAAEPGDVLTYQVTVGNGGDAPATAVVVEDELPEGAVFLDATPSEGEVDVDGGTIVWRPGDLPVGGSQTLVVRVEVGEGQWESVLVNRVGAGHDPEDCVGECPEPMVGHPCEDEPSLSCAVTTTPAPPVPEPTEPPPTTDPPPARPGAPAPDVPARTGPLPRTGGQLAVLVIAGIAVALLGGAVVAISRRRVDSEKQRHPQS